MLLYKVQEQKGAVGVGEQGGRDRSERGMSKGKCHSL